MSIDGRDNRNRNDDGYGCDRTADRGDGGRSAAPPRGKDDGDGGGGDDDDGTVTLSARSNVPSLVCAFSASCTTGGAIYAFGIYGDALKRSLHLSQTQLDSLSATFFVAGLLTWIPGMVVDRCGTRFSFVSGGLCGATFMMMYWALARRILVVPPVLILPLLYCLSICICLSCGLIIGSIFKLTTLCGGHGTRGSAVGVAKGFVGLGAGLYACIFSALPTPSALDFLPVIATFFVLCATLPAYLLLPRQQLAVRQYVVSETTPRHFRVMYASLLLLGIVIVGSSVLDLVLLPPDESDTTIAGNSNDGTTKNTGNYGKVALILVLWWGPIASLLVLPRAKPTKNDTFGEASDEQQRHSPSTDDLADPDEVTSLIKTPIMTPTMSQNGAPSNHHARDLNLGQMLCQLSAWLMLWTAAILVGSGTYKTNNMGQMVSALQFAQPDMVVPATLAIFSVSQMVARVLTGVISEMTLPSNNVHDGTPHGIPRPFYLIVASAIGAVSHFSLAYSTGQVSFVLNCAVSGLAFGMVWPLMVLIIGEVYGTAHVGANYMFYDGSSKAVGTTFLSTYVAGTIYDSHVVTDGVVVPADHGDGPGVVRDDMDCIGSQCFRATHLIVSAFCLSGVVASAILYYMTRRVYHPPRPPPK